MVTVLGIPLIGSLFTPTVLAIITFCVIWSLSTRKKDAACTSGLISAGKGPNESSFTLNTIGSKSKKEVLKNRVGSSSGVASDDEGCINGSSQLEVHCTANAKRKVFRSKAGDQSLQTLLLESDLTKKNVRNKKCKGKSGCCSKKKGASNTLEGTIETLNVFFGTQTEKSKVKYTLASHSSSYYCSTIQDLFYHWIQNIWLDIIVFCLCEIF